MADFYIFEWTILADFSTILKISKIQKFLDAGIQDVSTSISIVHDLIEKHKFSKGRMMVMKVTNIYKHEIVDTRA